MASHKDKGALRWPYYLICMLFFLGCCAMWTQSHKLRETWANVPPAPSQLASTLISLGDRQLAYRSFGLMLQNFGDVGGRVTSLDDYNYEMLGTWFALEDYLDPISQFTPYLAAFYFANAKHDEQLRVLVNYLSKLGKRPGYQKWRWLGQAVFIARYRLNDLDLALSLANELAEIEEEGMPRWTKQMPAFIMAEQGEREASYDLLFTMLREEAEMMQPAEVNFIVYYICDRILTPEEKALNPLCQRDY